MSKGTGVTYVGLCDLAGGDRGHSHGRANCCSRSGRGRCEGRGTSGEQGRVRGKFFVFLDREPACTEAGVWLEPEAAERREASGPAADLPGPGERLLRSLMAPHGGVPAFVARVARLQKATMEEDRRAMAVELLALSVIPEELQSVARQRTSRGGSWDDFTAPERVRWAVHAGRAEEPWWPLGVVQGPTWRWEEAKATIYSSVLTKLLLDAVSEISRTLGDAEQLQLLRALCVHYNVSAAEVDATGKLLLSTEARSLKFDLNPGDAKRVYKGKRLTVTQRETGVADGRKKRAFEKFG